MSNVTSQYDNKRLGFMLRFGRGLGFSLLAALPLCGLILFFEITRPAQLQGVGSVAAELTSIGTSAAAYHTGRHAVARLEGVSAELRQSDLSQAEAKLFSASDAASAFARTEFAGLKAGSRTEFVTKNHHRVALRIVSREAIVDQAVPNNARLMDIVPASTANSVSFVWGPWLYVAEVEDKGLEPEVVVQKVL